MIRLILALVLSFATPSSTVWKGAVELPDGTKLEFSVELEKDSGTISIPAQGAKDLPLDHVSVTDKELRFSIESAGAAWELAVSEDGKSATGVLRQGAELKTTMKRLAAGEKAVKELRRPQEPKPPFPYESVAVRFENARAGATLDGTLSVPPGTGPFPCVVLVTGSGPQDRDESLMGHRPFLVIADHLARHGIAVLRYDDRGTAKSTGTFDTATTDDFAEDALAAVAFLKTRKEVGGKPIGIVGHSEGGLIAPMCAAKSKDVAFLVLLAGTGVRGAELLPLQGKLISLAAGMPAAEAEANAKDTADILALMIAGKSDAELKESLRAVLTRQLGKVPESERASRVEQLVAAQMAEVCSPWARRFVVLDPEVCLKKVTCPVLAMNGEKDLQVPPKQNLPRIEKALKEAGNPDVTILEMPGLNHLFQTCTTGAPSEYAEIEETFSPAALDAMTKWIRKRSGLE